MSRPTLLSCSIALIASLAYAAIAESSDGPASVTPVEDRGCAACDYGIAVAFQGDLGRAESVFVRLLAQLPRDARALTNLGNLNLMRGETTVAMAFYERAAAADTADAGILLNQSTGLLVLGETEAASRRIAYATERAGGVREAARLLGLHMTVENDPSKADAKTRVNQEEILNLLRAVATGVPGDSLRVPAGGSGTPGAKASGSPRRRAPVWRAAGARAGDQEVASILYWKH